MYQNEHFDHHALALCVMCAYIMGRTVQEHFWPLNIYVFKNMVPSSVELNSIFDPCMSLCLCMRVVQEGKFILLP